MLSLKKLHKFHTLGLYIYIFIPLFYFDLQINFKFSVNFQFRFYINTLVHFEFLNFLKQFRFFFCLKTEVSFGKKKKQKNKILSGCFSY